MDSLQAMHYLMTIGEMNKHIQILDIFSIFVANIMHDYEHPGYTNQFIVRTKHPIALRYSDVAVLE
jgi:cGMP-inhibited 3',5'-cyclic phosphodiesterase B/cGMP-inhibited 3',5'-cyclic phosphodiesterase A